MDAKRSPAEPSRNLLIDHSVQLTVLRRAAFYTLACSLYFIMTLVITESLSNPQEAISETTRRCLDEAFFWAPGIVLLAPFMIYDLLRVTHRLAVPIKLLHQEMKDLVDDDPSKPVGVADGHANQDITECFQIIRAELLELREFRANHG